MSADVEGEVTVTLGGQAPVRVNGEFTFGRAEECDGVLDPDDVGISRLAGSVVHEGSVWWLVNRSGSRPLTVIDELGLRSLLPPGRRVALETSVTVVVEGSAGEHALAVAVTGTVPAVDGGDPPAAGLPTKVGEGVLVNEADRLALVALFAGYLEEHPRHDPNPKSYAAAAARLGWPRTTLVKRIEYLRSRLDAAGVPGMTGWNALNNLAEYVLTTGIVTKSDLRLVYPDR